MKYVQILESEKNDSEAAYRALVALGNTVRVDPTTSDCSLAELTKDLPAPTGIRSETVLESTGRCASSLGKAHSRQSRRRVPRGSRSEYGGCCSRDVVRRDP